MNPEPYLLRPSDWSSVPAVFGVLGITSLLLPAGCSVHPLARSSVPMPPTIPHRSRGCICYHPHSTITDKRRPSQNPHQTLYPPPGEPIFSGAGITSGGVA